MENEIIPKDQKKMLAKTLLDLNCSATEISELLNIDRSTVYRYSQQPTSEELQQFATEIKTIFAVKQFKLIAKILKRMDALVERSFDLKALTNAFNIIKSQTQSIYDIHKASEHEKKWDSVGAKWK
jgi:predicted transcriptional regulator